jgi:hypothetical protein
MKTRTDEIVKKYIKLLLDNYELEESELWDI